MWDAHHFGRLCGYPNVSSSSLSLPEDLVKAVPVR